MLLICQTFLSGLASGCTTIKIAAEVTIVIGFRRRICHIGDREPRRTGGKAYYIAAAPSVGRATFKTGARPRFFCTARRSGLGVNLGRLRISAARLLYPGDLNRSTQHLLILLDKEVADGDVTDIVHGEAEG